MNIMNTSSRQLAKLAYSCSVDIRVQERGIRLIAISQREDQIPQRHGHGRGQQRRKIPTCWSVATRASAAGAPYSAYCKRYKFIVYIRVNSTQSTLYTPVRSPQVVMVV